MNQSPSGFESLIEGELSQWLEGLPSYQRSLIESMTVASGDLSEVAIAWLAASGARDTAPLGGVRAGATQFYDNLLTEMQELLCGGERYELERQELRSAGNWTRMGIASFVAVAIGPHVGVAAVVIAPAVAIVLAIISSAGRTTVCGRLSNLIDERSRDKPSPKD